MADTESFSDNQNFEDLLDEDGQPTRELDTWLAENIGGWVVESGYYDKETNRKYHWYVHNPNTGIDTFANRNINEVLNEEGLPNYTTGDSIDPILNLAKNYFVDEENVLQLIIGETSEELNLCRSVDGGVVSQYWNDMKIAIAEALFKAYQAKGEE